MNNYIAFILMLIVFVTVTRLSFYLIDVFKSMSKPKFLYFRDITFELLVSSVILSIFVLIYLVLHFVGQIIEIINNLK